jgi:hypothetical protein
MRHDASHAQEGRRLPAETGATMWIQHDPVTNAPLRKAPEYYD